MIYCKTAKHIPRNEAFYDRLVIHCQEITCHERSFLAGDDKNKNTGYKSTTSSTGKRHSLYVYNNIKK